MHTSNMQYTCVHVYMCNTRAVHMYTLVMTPGQVSSSTLWTLRLRPGQSQHREDSEALSSLYLWQSWQRSINSLYWIKERDFIKFLYPCLNLWSYNLLYTSLTVIHAMVALSTLSARPVSWVPPGQCQSASDWGRGLILTDSAYLIRHGMMAARLRGALMQSLDFLVV